MTGIYRRALAGRGVDVAQGTLYRAAQAGAELVGADAVAQWAKEGSERNEREAAAVPSASLSGIASLEGFGEWAKQTIGETLPVIAPSLAGAGAGAVVGSVVPVVGTGLGALIGAFVPSFAMGVGEVQSGIKERDPNAVQPGYAFIGGSPSRGPASL